MSVCIPTYNGASYLRCCLESVLAQTVSDLEILVVDDCSSDESTVIAEDYARRDSRVRTAANRANLGLVGNWNQCGALARGEWIKFVFQDDVIAPTCVEALLTAASGSKAAIVSCARDFIFESGTTDEDRDFYCSNQEEIAREYTKANPWSAQRCAEMAVRRLGRNLFGEPTAVLLHKSVFERFGWFNPHLYSSCDTEYWVRVATNTGTVHVPETLASFRVHPGSATARYRRTERTRFRCAEIDPLLMLHDFVFDPRYAKLRDAVALTASCVDLRGEVWTRALRAERRVRGAAMGGDGSLLEEWQRVIEAYPRFTSIPSSARARAIWRGLMRRLSFRRAAGES